MKNFNDEITNIGLFISTNLIFWYLYLLMSTIYINLKKLFKEREE